jgi:hypothetical protein
VLNIDRYKHVEALEKRLSKMEALLQRQSSVQLADSDDAEDRVQIVSANRAKKRKVVHSPLLSSESSHGQKRQRIPSRRTSISSTHSSNCSADSSPETIQDSMTSSTILMVYLD